MESEKLIISKLIRGYKTLEAKNNDNLVDKNNVIVCRKLYHR